jgi:hypothetical protein
MVTLPVLGLVQGYLNYPCSSKMESLQVAVQLYLAKAFDANNQVLW